MPTALTATRTWVGASGSAGRSARRRSSAPWISQFSMALLQVLRHAALFFAQRGLHALGHGAQPVEVHLLVLRHAHAGLDLEDLAVLAVVLLGEHGQSLDLLADVGPQHAVERRHVGAAG